MAITTGTTGIVLPTEVSDEVWAKVQQGSTVMRLSNRIDLPYAGAEVPMITGDWTSACYGVHEDVSFDVSNQSTLTLPDGTNLNLWQNDMFACKIEFVVGWRYKWLDQFCKLTGAAVASE